MEIFWAIILGTVQGLTEFLPISSSGHLLLLEEISGAKTNGLLTMLVLHLGTLVAVCIVMWDSIKKLFRPPYKNLLLLVLATIPSAILGLLLSDTIDSVFSSGKLLPFTFLLTAILLFLCQKIRTRTTILGTKTALLMGIGQTFALLPGLSRSGTTIACGMISGTDKEKVGEFSFLMSAPIILGGTIVNLYKIFSGNVQSSSISITPLLVGALTACVVGLVSIRKMLELIKKSDFTPFCIYLAVLSVICFVNYYLLPIW